MTADEKTTSGWNNFLFHLGNRQEGGRGRKKEEEGRVAEAAKELGGGRVPPRQESIASGLHIRSYNEAGLSR